MKRIANVLFAIIFAVALFSCDKVDLPVSGTSDGPIITDTGVNVRKILIEEFTGLGCGFCPPAAEKAAQLQELYGEQIIVIALNTGFFADPSQGNPYDEDWRTDDGNEIAGTFLGVSATYPTGMISRSSIISGSTDNLQIRHSSWSTAIERLKDIAPEISIKIDAVYNAQSNSVDISTMMIPLTNMEGEYNLALSLVENNVIGPQKYYGKDPEDIYDYVHKHVYRGNINSTWGEKVIDGAVVAGDTIEVVNTNFVLNPDYNPNECLIVAYLHDKKSDEIIQVEEVYVIEVEVEEQ